jgi:hypothetical protein
MTGRTEQQPRPADTAAGAAARSQAGRSARSRGLAFQRTLALELRAPDLWPAASVESEHRKHDIFGIGDLGLEATVEPWSEIDRKVKQARADAKSRGVSRWAVIKKRRGSASPLDGYAVTEARIFVRMARLIEQLEAAAADAQQAYDRGYDHGRAARDRAAGKDEG